MKKILSKILLLPFLQLFICLNIVFASEAKLPQITLGKENANIVIKEYFSLTCTHCASFHINTFPKLKKKLIDTGKVKFEFIFIFNLVHVEFYIWNNRLDNIYLFK